MAKLSKRVQALRAKVDPTKTYALEDALKMVKGGATANFNECLDV
jgi:large subunit ribosomal protein L1